MGKRSGLVYLNDRYILGVSFTHSKSGFHKKNTCALEVKESVYGQWRTELKVPQPASKLSGVLWRRGGKRKESL